MGGWGKHNNRGGNNQQRYHKGRSDMVVPGVTGVLVSCDPMATGKAIRELKLLLEPFKPATDATLHTSHAETHSHNGTSSSSASQAEQQQQQAPSSSAGSGFSLAAMLAEELDSFRRPAKPDLVVANMTGVDVDPDEGDEKKKRGDGPRRPQRQFRQEWFATLETNCKGYVFVNIPKAQPAAPTASTTRDQEAEAEAEKEEHDETAEPVKKQARVEVEDRDSKEVDGNTDTNKDSGDNSSTPAPATTTTTTTPAAAQRVHINPVVTQVSESVMESLSSNPRPVTRFSFRLIPVELSCNPTLPNIVAGAKALAETIEMPPGRSLIRIGVVFNVKNNTTIQKEKNYIKAAIEAALPKNRFAVFGYWNTNWQVSEEQKDNAKFLIEVDALLHVFVAHSTCCMGVQRHMTIAEGRRMYNLHDFGTGTLSLGDMAGKATPAAAAAVEEEEEEEGQDDGAEFSPQE